MFLMCFILAFSILLSAGGAGRPTRVKLHGKGARLVSRDNLNLVVSDNQRRTVNGSHWAQPKSVEIPRAQARRRCPRRSQCRWPCSQRSRWRARAWATWAAVGILAISVMPSWRRGFPSLMPLASVAARAALVRLLISPASSSVTATIYVIRDFPTEPVGTLGKSQNRTPALLVPSTIDRRRDDAQRGLG